MKNSISKLLLIALSAVTFSVNCALRLPMTPAERDRLFRQEHGSMQNYYSYLKVLKQQRDAIDSEMTKLNEMHSVSNSNKGLPHKTYDNTTKSLPNRTASIRHK